MRDPQTSRFAARIHDVVDLDVRGAPFEAIESFIDSLSYDVEEQSALWLLAWSLRNPMAARRAVSGDTLDVSYG
jgi:hypothetical protein